MWSYTKMDSVWKTASFAMLLLYFKTLIGFVLIKNDIKYHKTQKKVYLKTKNLKNKKKRLKKYPKKVIPKTQKQANLLMFWNQKMNLMPFSRQ